MAARSPGGDAILASLYLNAQVYTGTVAASGLTKGTARWQDAITAADLVQLKKQLIERDANGLRRWRWDEPRTAAVPQGIA